MRIADTGLESQVGTSTNYFALDPIGESSLRYFAEALRKSAPQVDDEGGEELGADYLQTPTLIFETNQYTGRRPDENGYSGHSWAGIPSDAVWIRGGNEYKFGRPVCGNDRLAVKWTLVEVRDITTKEGREMVRIVSEAEVRTSEGDWLGWTRETMFLADRPSHND